MPQGVIDALELVEIEEKHRSGRTMPLAQRDGMFDTIQQQSAIRQPGQTVKVGHLLQLCLGRLDVRNIIEHTDIMGRLLVAVIDGIDAEQLGVQLARITLVPNFPRPVPISQNGLPHLAIEALVVHAGLAKARILAQHLLHIEAGHRHISIVHVENRTVEIGNHDRFRRALEHPLEQAKLLLRRRQLGNLLRQGLIRLRQPLGAIRHLRFQISTQIPQIGQRLAESFQRFGDFLRFTIKHHRCRKRPHISLAQTQQRPVNMGKSLTYVP